MKNYWVPLVRILCVLAVSSGSFCFSYYKEKPLADRDDLRFGDIFGIKRDSLITERINNDREKRVVMFADWKNSFMRMCEKLAEWPFLDTLARQLDSARILSIMEADTLGAGLSNQYPHLSIVPMTKDEMILRFGTEGDAGAYQVFRTRMLVVRYNALDTNCRYSWINAMTLLHELCHDYLYRRGFEEDTDISEKKYGDPYYEQHKWIARVESMAKMFLLKVGKKENPKWDIWNCYIAFDDQKDEDESPSSHFKGDMRSRAAQRHCSLLTGFY